LPLRGGARPARAQPQGATRRRATLLARGPWLIATSFAVYSGQWLAVIGFLPSIYTQDGISGGTTAVVTAFVRAIYPQAGISGATTGVLTARAAAVNMIGNIGSGRLLHRGTTPTTL